jgi:hypothetical protein
VIENFSQIPTIWTSFSVEPQEYIDAGDHVVVTGVQRHRRGRVLRVALSPPVHAE